MYLSRRKPGFNSPWDYQIFYNIDGSFTAFVVYFQKGVFLMVHFWMLPSNSSAMPGFSSRMMLSSARPKLKRLMLPYQRIF